MLSEANRAWLERMAPVFAEAESNEAPDSEQRTRLIADANRRRADRGIRPLRVDAEDPPEMALYRRARALGLSRRRG